MLPALAVSLALLLALEWLLPGPAAPLCAPPPAIPAAAATVESDARIAAWGNTILARPLLNQGRRPMRQPSTQVSETLPRLSAIIIIGDRRSAIFAAEGQKPQIIAEGGEIGDYRLKNVASGKVDLIGPNGIITLRPQFLPTPPSESF